MAQASPSRENKMGTMPVGRLIFKMSAPLMASMLFQALYNIVDSVFVARLNQDALNAVSLAFPFQMLMMALANGTGVGINALVSRSLGEKKQEAADRATGTGIFLIIISAIVFCILGWTVSKTYYALQTDNQRIIAYGTSYMSICAGICFGLFGQMVGERLLQATGRTDLSMISQICGAVCNMILDPIFIFGKFGFPKMEVAGAALATIIGQFLAAAIAFTLNLTKNREIHIRLRLIRFHKATAKEIYRIGSASILMQAIGSVLNFFLNLILISFTQAATAVFGAYYKIQSFIFMPVFGLNNAMVPILSYNYGARKTDRVKKTMTICVIVAISIMCIGTLLFETIPDTLLGLFTPTQEMLEVGRIAFRIIGIHFPVAGFCIVASSVCQALGKPMYSLITSVCRQLVALLPAAYLLSLTGSVNNVWWAFPIAEVVSAILSIFFIIKTLAHLKTLDTTKRIN